MEQSGAVQGASKEGDVPRVFTEVEFSHIIELIRTFKDVQYTTQTHTNTHNEILEAVKNLWSLDYACMMIKGNEDGSLCDSYPRTLIVPDIAMKSKCRIHLQEPKTIGKMRKDYKEGISPFPMAETKYINASRVHEEDASALDMSPQRYSIISAHQGVEYHSPLEMGVTSNAEVDLSMEYVYGKLAQKASVFRSMADQCKYGRSRKRFTFPAILYRNKIVARSSTVPLTTELTLHHVQDAIASYFVPAAAAASAENTEEEKKELAAIEEMKKKQKESEEDPDCGLWGTDAARRADIKMLDEMNIKSIFDLMVEKQKVRFYVHCCSSEKIELEWYGKFTINQVPYPGCEFFATFQKRGRKGHKLNFDWTNPEVNATLKIGENLQTIQKNWKYQTWTLNQLTEVYLMAMLKELKEGSNGILVHCISGWDRTPLFISLLRLSLWADGEAHQSFTPAQMLYFTIAYDWMFFSHNLKDRRRKGEEIMFFCFYFLKYIKGENFNTNAPVFGTVKEIDLPFDSVTFEPNSSSKLSSSSELSSFEEHCPSPSKPLLPTVPGTEGVSQSTKEKKEVLQNFPGKENICPVASGKEKVLQINLGKVQTTLEKDGRLSLTPVKETGFSPTPGKDGRISQTSGEGRLSLTPGSENRLLKSPSVEGNRSSTPSKYETLKKDADSSGELSTSLMDNTGGSLTPSEAYEAKYSMPEEGGRLDYDRALMERSGRSSPPLDESLKNRASITNSKYEDFRQSNLRYKKLTELRHIFFASYKIGILGQDYYSPDEEDARENVEDLLEKFEIGDEESSP